MVQCELTEVPAVIKELANRMEKEDGHRPSETSIRIASLAYEFGRQIADRGYQDQQAHREPRPLSVFESVTKDMSAGASIAKLLHDNYMIGYTGEKEATKT